MLEVDDGDSETFSYAGDLADRWSLFHDPAPTFGPGGHGIYGI
jgi:hypothetical protein